MMHLLEKRVRAQWLQHGNQKNAWFKKRTCSSSTASSTHPLAAEHDTFAHQLTQPGLRLLWSSSLPTMRPVRGQLTCEQRQGSGLDLWRQKARAKEHLRKWRVRR